MEIKYFFVEVVKNKVFNNCSVKAEKVTFIDCTFNECSVKGLNTIFSNCSLETSVVSGEEIYIC